MKRLLIVLSLITVCLANAAAYDYVVDSCTVDVTVSRDSLHEITESYSIDYYVAKHGFFRYIPLDYSEAGVRARVLNLSVSDPASRSDEDGWCIVKIGSPSHTVQGVKDYRISYVYDLGSDTNEGFDQFYYNIVGSGWDVPFKKVNFNITVPGTSTEANGIWLTSGDYGSTDTVQAEVHQYDGYYVITGSAQDLRPGQALTLRIEFPDGWYKAKRDLGVYEYWDFSGVMGIVGIFVAAVSIVLSFFIWNSKGRDKIPVITAKYNPPEGFTPMETGFVADENVDDKDITSMLYYWADKGYMCINEPKEGHFTFTKIFDLDSDAPNYEKNLFNGIFRRMDEFKTVKLDDFSSGSLYNVILNTKIDVKKRFTGKQALNEKNGVWQFLCILMGVLSVLSFDCGALLSEFDFDMLPFAVVFSILFTFLTGVVFFVMFRKWHVRKTNVFVIILAVVVVLFSCLFHIVFALAAEKSVLKAVLAVAADTVCMLFAVITSKRTPYGDKVLEDVLGYREFIQKVSIDEIRMMIDKDPQYYYHVLSYAIVLGLDNVWASKFKNITMEPPVWYGGYSHYMGAMHYSMMSSRLRRAVSMSSVPPQVKSASKLGGISLGSSGFSGGGFGGGGGRAW